MNTSSKTPRKEKKPSDRALPLSELQSLLARMPLNPRQSDQINGLVKSNFDILNKRLEMLAHAAGFKWLDQTTHTRGWAKRPKKLW